MRLAAVLVLALACARGAPPGSSFDDVQARFNACLGRAEPPSGFHLWNGAHGHAEVGNVFIGVVHAFADALLANRRLAVSAANDRATGQFGHNDVGTLQRVMRAFATRLPWAPVGCEKLPRTGDAAGCTESGWHPLNALEKLADDAREAVCLREATRCEDNPYHRRSVGGATCCRVRRRRLFFVTRLPEREAVCQSRALALAGQRRRLRARVSTVCPPAYPPAARARRRARSSSASRTPRSSR